MVPNDEIGIEIEQQHLGLKVNSIQIWNWKTSDYFKLLFNLLQNAIV
jgi:hypothetical protein